MPGNETSTDCRRWSAAMASTISSTSAHVAARRPDEVPVVGLVEDDRLVALLVECFDVVRAVVDVEIGFDLRFGAPRKQRSR